MASSSVLDRYKCGLKLPEFGLTGRLGESSGYFRLGPDMICYGRLTEDTSTQLGGTLVNAFQCVQHNEDTICLPFDANQIQDDLRFERYASASSWQRWVETWMKRVYYGLRPVLPDSLRRQLQRSYLLDRQDTRNFPNWPVDRTADILLEKLLALAMQSSKMDRIPFIWFWPDGYKAAAILTHDVETTAGRNFCESLMDLDDEFGIKSSFQVVPEKRYTVSPAYLESIRSRGFELNIHGLDHEGDLFQNRARFIECAKKINSYAEMFGSRGFRSPCFYRNADWFRDLNFSYDMSFPNVAHLEPQQGGCCTVLPYFLPGGILEIPLTTTEDHTLFHLLEDYSMKLWKQQINRILEGHGLINVLVHPDYVIAERARSAYMALLEEMCQLGSKGQVWLTLPGEVDRWWRRREGMRLVHNGCKWRIEGRGNERARIAYACLDGDRLVYELEPSRPSYAQEEKVGKTTLQ